MRPRRAAARHAARALVSLPHQPGDLVLGHRRARERAWRASVRRCLRLHARRDQPFRRRPAARRGRPGEPAAHPYRRLEVHRAVLGPRGLRAPAASSRRAGSARLHRHRHRPRRALRPPRGQQRASTGTGVPLKDFTSETTKSFSSEQIWDAVCKPQAAADRGRRGARPRMVEGARPRHPAFPAHRLVPVPDARGQGLALRDALPGAVAAHRPGAAAGCTRKA